MFRLMSSLVVCLAFVAILAGCGPTDDRSATVSATASVTYNGQAIEGAHVTFSPTAESGDAAFGDTDAQGKAALRTSWGEGVVPGSYKVTVTKMEAVGGASTGTGENEDEEEDEEGGDVVYEARLPEKYGNVNTSGLDATVTEDGENSFSFDLTD